MKLNFRDMIWEKEGIGEVSFKKSCVKIKKTDGSMSRVKCTFPIENNSQTLKFSVNLKTKGVKNNLSAYAVITQRPDEGKALERCYAVNENEKGTKKSFIFKLREGCTKLTIELGLKCEGKVVFNEPILEEVKEIKKRPVRIACTKIIYGETKEIQLEKIEAMIDKIAPEKPDLIAFSEHINTHGVPGTPKEKAETTEGMYCTAMSKKAKEYKTYIVANFTEKDDKGYYNTSVLIGRDGKIKGKYRKTHLAFGEYEAGLTPGSSHDVFETDFGKVGMLVCWDAYFPEPARILAKKGAELIVISTVGDPGFRHVSRALENGVYVAVSGAQFQNLNDKKIGASKIIAPDGKILSEVHEFGEYAFYEIDLSDKTTIGWLSFETDGIPDNVYMNERRPDLYDEMI